MKFNEFHKLAKQNVAERKQIPIEQLDEVLPALAVAGRVAATGVGMAGRAAGKLAAKGAQGVGNLAAKGAQGAGRVGTKMGKAVVQTAKDKAAAAVKDKANSMIANKLLKPGSTIPIGGQDMKVDAVKGNEITVADPKNQKGPKIVFDKDSDEIKGGLETLTQRVM